VSQWRPSGSDPEAELKEADLLLQKADALLRRHNVRIEPQIQADPDPDEDLPLLTDIVDHLEVEPLLRLDPAPSPTSEPVSSPEPASVAHSPVELAELLVTLDTALAREIEAWFATELPQLVEREFASLAQRMQAEALAHMRATLLPELSERISKLLAGTSTDR
jgi:hypothetical protein